MRTRGTRYGLKLAHVAPLLLGGLLILPLPALADDDGAGCRPVSGRYTANPLPPSSCFSPVGFCTAGTLTGGLHGSYTFTMSSARSAEEPTAPGMTFYTGVSLVEALGGSLVGTDTGTVDLSPVGTGRQAALITLTGGAEGLEGTTGYLTLVGELSLMTGEVQGRYSGELCGPAIQDRHSGRR
ncbi:MAG: hypothetical protein P1V51_03005 [Deltaproteobacteria bacterium]|nr:hypothetical protein [Deltaproteobacteria bacterium]